MLKLGNIKNAKKDFLLNLRDLRTLNNPPLISIFSYLISVSLKPLLNSFLYLICPSSIHLFYQNLYLFQLIIPSSFINPSPIDLSFKTYVRKSWDKNFREKNLKIKTLEKSANFLKSLEKMSLEIKSHVF